MQKITDRAGYRACEVDDSDAREHSNFVPFHTAGECEKDEWRKPTTVERIFGKSCSKSTAATLLLQ